MAGKTIGSLLIGVGLDASQMQKNLKNMEYSLKRTADKFKSYGSELSTAISLPVIAGAAYAVKAFADEENAITKLKSCIQSNGKDVAVVSKQYQDFAARMQKLTVVEDDVVLSNLQLAESMKLANPQQAVQGAIGLSRAFGIDLDTALKATAKGLNGQWTSLQKLIPTLKLAGSDTEKAAMFNKVLADSFVLAQDETKSTSGQLIQLKNDMGDLAEEFGSIIAQYMTPFIAKLKEGIKWFSGLSEETKKMIVNTALISAAVGPATFAIGKLIQTASGAIGIIRSLSVVLGGMTIAGGAAVAALIAGTGYIIANWTDINKLIKDSSTSVNDLNEKSDNWKTLNLAIADSYSFLKSAANSFFDWYSNKIGLITGETQEYISLFEIAFNYGKKLGSRFIPGQAAAGSLKAGQLPYGLESMYGRYEGNSGTFVPETITKINKGLKDTAEKIKKVAVAAVKALPSINGFVGGLLSGSSVPSRPGTKGYVESAKVSPFAAPQRDIFKIPTENITSGLSAAQLKVNEFKDTVNTAFQDIVENGIKNAIDGFSSLFATIITGGDIKSAFANILIGLLDVLEQFAKLAIAAGIAATSLGQALKNPLNPANGIAALAGGIALLTIAKTAKGFLGKAKGFASGGIFGGESLIRVGEYPGASSNPEVVAPLSKLKDMLRMGGGGGDMRLSVVIDSRLQGNDIRQSYDRTKSKYMRV